MANNDIVIVSAVRTPIGKFCAGGISSLQAHELGAIVIKESLKRAQVPASDVSEVIFGQVLVAGHGQNPVRQAATIAGVPYSAPAFGVSKLCGSGLKSIILGYQAIKCEDANIVVCGGQESMSQAHHSTYLRSGTYLGNSSLTDTLLCDGLTDIFHNIHMGETAERVADRYKISREEQDATALESQRRTKASVEGGKFDEEIVPVTLPKRAEPIIRDEYPQPNTIAETLQKSKPAFRKEGGTVTAGNASGINDGAAAVVLMKKSEAEKRGLPILAKIVGHATSGCEPDVMGLGPIGAVNILLSKIGWKKDEVDLYELNEAFAAQAIAVNKELGLDPSKVNTRGGAIALGHPIGASGTRIIVTLLHAMKQDPKARRGVASLCIGGGMGIAMAVEKV